MKSEFYIYVGTYTEDILFGTGEVLEGKGEGIYVFRMDPTSGEIESHHTMEGIRNPSYLTLSPSNEFLYAVNELKKFRGEKTGTVSAYNVDPGEKEFNFLNKRPTRGTDPCHVSMDKTGKYVLAANYGTGSISVFPTKEDGSLGKASEFIQHEGSSINQERQEGPHAHSIFLDKENRYAYVPDLGLDELRVYKFKSEKGEFETCEDKNFEVEPGAGPRQIAFHPTESYVYLINELNSTLMAFSRDEKEGDLKQIQTVSTLPSDFTGESSTAEVIVSPSGEYVYGSNRGHDSIVIYEIDQDTGKLKYVDHESTRGRTPRHFAIDPTGRFLLAANQDSDNIVTFEIDRETGKLSHTGKVIDVPTPVCVRILEGPKKT